MQNSTVQWCLAYQALRVTNVKMISVTANSWFVHGYGGNWGGNYASYHHNLIAVKAVFHALVPIYYISTEQQDDGERVDMRDNIYYNWGGEAIGGEAQHVNIVNNYYKPGPGTDESGKADRTYRIAKPDVSGKLLWRSLQKMASNLGKVLYGRKSSGRQYDC